MNRYKSYSLIDRDRLSIRIYPKVWELSVRFIKDGWLVIGPVDIEWDFT